MPIDMESKDVHFSSLIEEPARFCAHVVHGPLTPELPTLLFARGNMTNGATQPWLRRPRLKTSDVMLLNCTSDLTLWDAVLGGSGPVGARMQLEILVCELSQSS